MCRIRTIQNDFLGLINLVSPSWNTFIHYHIRFFFISEIWQIILQHCSILGTLQNANDYESLNCLPFAKKWRDCFEVYLKTNYRLIKVNLNGNCLERKTGSIELTEKSQALALWQAKRLSLQTIGSEFDSHWVHHTSDFILTRLSYQVGALRLFVWF